MDLTVARANRFERIASRSIVDAFLGSQASRSPADALTSVALTRFIDVRARSGTDD
jgi:hypothetical protein